MTEMFGEAWLPMSVRDLAPDDDDYNLFAGRKGILLLIGKCQICSTIVIASET